MHISSIDIDLGNTSCSLVGRDAGGQLVVRRRVRRDTVVTVMNPRGAGGDGAMQPAKTSRTSSKPPSTDRKERRQRSRPGRAKPGHEGRKRALPAAPDAVIDHRPTGCPDPGLSLSAEVVGVHEESTSRR